MSEISMWKCGVCGAPNPQVSSVCYHCRADRPAPPSGGQTASASSASAGQAAVAPDPFSAQAGQSQPLQQFAASAQPSATGGVGTWKCPFCGADVAAGILKCMHCGEWLSEELSPDPPLSFEQKLAAATIAVLFWFFGIILGCIFLLGERKRLGRFYLQWALIGSIPWTIVFFGYQAIRSLTYPFGR